MIHELGGYRRERKAVYQRRQHQRWWEERAHAPHSLPPQQSTQCAERFWIINDTKLAYIQMRGQFKRLRFLHLKLSESTLDETFQENHGRFNHVRMEKEIQRDGRGRVFLQMNIHKAGDELRDLEDTKEWQGMYSLMCSPLRVFILCRNPNFFLAPCMAPRLLIRLWWQISLDD